MKRNASSVPASDEVYARLARLCSAGEHCVWDVVQKMHRWGLSQAESDRIVDRLVDEKYIDEERFARAYCNDRMRFSRWGRIKIAAMLRGMHVPDSAIRLGLEQLDVNEYREVLGSVIERKDRTLAEDDPYRRRVRLIRFAAGRGFELEEINKFLPED